jgi:hypothetical protein
MTEAPDFRSDPSDTPEGRGIAHGRRSDYWRAVPESVRRELQAEASYRSFEEFPPFVRDTVAAAVIEDAELIGFWVSWHRAGGFASLELAGWHRATIYRKIRRFRARFGVHPDEYRFNWITLDLERTWTDELNEVLPYAIEDPSRAG